MQLVGMLDSPFVRRAAISLHMLGVPFEHRSLSVFSDFETFRQINPLVKAPTLVCDDGMQLIDSSLIIDYAESIVASEQRLMPTEPAQRRVALRLIGLALLVAEKSVQIVYERKRPDELRYRPWLERVGTQLEAASAMLDREVGEIATTWLHGEQPGQADITTAVTWDFTRRVLPKLITAEDYPALASLAARAERLPAFRAWPLPNE
jgi:glutathione S-transferase